MNERHNFVQKRFEETGEAPEWVASYTYTDKGRIEPLELCLYNKNAKVKGRILLDKDSAKGLIESLQNYVDICEKKEDQLW